MKNLEDKIENMTWATRIPLIVLIMGIIGIIVMAEPPDNFKLAKRDRDLHYCQKAAKADGRDPVMACVTEQARVDAYDRNKLERVRF